MGNSLYRNRFLTLYLMLLAMAASFGASLTPPAQAGLFGLSEQDEIRAGEQVAQQAIKEYGQPLPANHPMSVRVRQIGQQFAQLSTRKNIPYSYTVLNNNEVLNAFAAPGGPIFVTTKLVQTAANDAELAYVLGHETAHIERKHIVDAVEKQQKVGLAVGILGAILGGNTGNTVTTIASVGWGLLSRGYSRDDEREADIVGTRWMSQLGYDPRAAMSMLGKLGSGTSGIAKYLATHPNPKDRQAVLQKLITDENLMDVARRRGGPKLTMTGGATPTYYGNDTYQAPTYYPPTTNAPTYYPPDNTPNTATSSIRSPLLIVDRGNQRIVLGPVRELAEWAGATLSNRGNLTTLRRGNRTLEFRRFSTVANINGRNVEMSAAADVYNGNLYAPIGTIADGLGANAALVDGNRAVQVTLDGRSALLRF